MFAGFDRHIVSQLSAGGFVKFEVVDRYEGQAAFLEVDSNCNDTSWGDFEDFFAEGLVIDLEFND